MPSYVVGVTVDLISPHPRRVYEITVGTARSALEASATAAQHVHGIVQPTDITRVAIEVPVVVHDFSAIKITV
jgi:hypothetical protein